LLFLTFILLISHQCRSIAPVRVGVRWSMAKILRIPTKVLKQTEFEALLPLLPLTQAGKSLDTVEDMINELQARNRPDLLTLSYNFAGLVFTDEVDQQWLKERFEKMQDILEDSWVYQEMTAKSLEKGREEGRQQGIQAAQQIAISIVARRFPELELLARAIISMIDNLHQLQMLAIELSVASSQEETKHLLFSLGSAI